MISGVPNAIARLSILNVLLKSTPHQLDESILDSIAGRTHGFVGADLSSLVHSAGLNAIKRSFALFSPAPPFTTSSNAGTITTTNPPLLASLHLLPSDLEHALLHTRPSAMRSLYLETPKVYWTDIGGQEDVKSRLRESIEWPLLHPESFKRLGVKPPRGILLYGPPGCSKTLIAKALATEGGLNFIAVKGPEVRLFILSLLLLPPSRLLSLPIRELYRRGVTDEAIRYSINTSENPRRLFEISSEKLVLPLHPSSSSSVPLPPILPPTLTPSAKNVRELMQCTTG